MKDIPIDVAHFAGIITAMGMYGTPNHPQFAELED